MFGVPETEPRTCPALLWPNEWPPLSAPPTNPLSDDREELWVTAGDSRPTRGCDFSKYALQRSLLTNTERPVADACGTGDAR